MFLLKFVSKGALRDTQLDDVNDFLECDQSMDHIGLSTQEKINIYSTVAAVLHLGNIQFEDDPDGTKGGCKILSTSEQSLSITSEMLGLDVRELRNALITRVLMTKTTSNSKDNMISYVISINVLFNLQMKRFFSFYFQVFH